MDCLRKRIQRNNRSTSEEKGAKDAFAIDL